MANVTIGDVAREAGVALGTVSNVLNHPEKVRPETIRRVADAVNKLGYAPNQSARVLAGGSSRAFGLIIPQLNHGIYLQIAAGASSQAAREGYDLLIASCAQDTSRIGNYRRYFAGTQMSGMLVASAAADLGVIAAHNPIPTVYLDIWSERPGDFICADNAAEGRLMAEHLVGQGVERIAVIGHPGTQKLRARAKGVHAAEMLYPHVDFDFIEVGDANKPEDGASALADLMAQPNNLRPQAIIALSDMLAAGAIRGAENLGLSVPDDLLVCGCDGNPLAWSCGVELTTCAPIGYELGRRGIKHLVEQIALSKSDPEQAASNEKEHCQDLVKPFVLARESTGGERQKGSSQLDLGLYL